MTKLITSKSFLIIMSLIAVALLCLGTLGIAQTVLSKLNRTVSPPEEEAQASWAPDGRRLTYVCYLEGPTKGESLYDVTFYIFRLPRSRDPWSHYTEEAADICIIDIDGSNHRHLVRDPGRDWSPVWSPDGSRIAYLRDEGIYIIDVEGRNPRQLLWSGKVYGNSITWSPDGTKLLFSGCNLTRDIFLLDINRKQITNLTPDSSTQDIDPQWLFNGSKVFYLTTASFEFFNPNNCNILTSIDKPYQMKVMNLDGSAKQDVYKPFFYSFIAISNFGEIAFSSDLTSRTKDEVLPDHQPLRLYKMSLDNQRPIEVSVDNLTQSPFFPPIRPWWSPNGDNLLYMDKAGRVRLLDVKTNETRHLPSNQTTNDNGRTLVLEYRWAPDSKYLAATIFSGQGINNIDNNYLYEEKHIFIFDLQNHTIRPLVQK